jgi:hypothetical protein
MNESMVHHAARSVKLISDSLGLPTIAEVIHDDTAGPTASDEINEQLYERDELRTFRVPVTLTREGFVTVKARDAKTAENVANAVAAFADDIENAVQSESVGTAVEA